MLKYFPLFFWFPFRSTATGWTNVLVFTKLLTYLSLRTTVWKSSVTGLNHIFGSCIIHHVITLWDDSSCEFLAVALKAIKMIGRILYQHLDEHVIIFLRAFFNSSLNSFYIAICLQVIQDVEFFFSSLDFHNIFHCTSSLNPSFQECFQ